MDDIETRLLLRGTSTAADVDFADNAAQDIKDLLARVAELEGESMEGLRNAKAVRIYENIIGDVEAHFELGLVETMRHGKWDRGPMAWSEPVSLTAFHLAMQGIATLFCIVKHEMRIAEREARRLEEESRMATQAAAKRREAATKRKLTRAKVAND